MKKSNIRTKTHNLYKVIFLFVVFLGIGYAFLEANLNINGDVTVEAPEFNTYVQSVSVTSGSTSGTPVIVGNDKKEVDFTTALTSDVNSFFETSVTLTNKGSKDAYLQSIDVKVYDGITEVTLAAPYEYILTNNDGTVIEPGHKLTINGTDTYKIKFNYISGTDMSTVTTYPNYTFKIIYNYTSHSFETDSWDTIKTNYQADPNYYPLGGLKEVQLDLDNDGTSETTAHLRIANTSTPAECSTEGFSQTACGLVLEFADIITTHRMNQYVTGISNGDGNRGGWEYSDMRAYLNSTTYAYENIDYSTSGIYSALPSELRNKIIETRVVSGYGYKEKGSANFTTTDKIYLFSPHEVWEDVDGNTSSGIDYYDKSYSNTRQLDYYKAKGVTTSNYSEAIKKNLSGSNYPWLLRSAYSESNLNFFAVHNYGYWSGYNSNDTRGVSPAFRIA